jgi:hypothetical protein
MGLKGRSCLNLELDLTKKHTHRNTSRAETPNGNKLKKNQYSAIRLINDLPDKKSPKSKATKAMNHKK